MSERAKRRAQSASIGPDGKVPDDSTLCVERPWLNGWPRINRGRAVLIGVGVRCVCCGTERGVTCVAFPPDWEPPGPEPQWPFDLADCPLCALYPPYT